MIKVAIVDDNQINIITIKEKLAPYQDVLLVFEATNGEDFFEDKLEYYESYEELIAKVNYFLANEKERIDKSIWLRKRVHDLFNSKRVAAYILDLINKNEKELIKYEWYK